MEFDVKALFCFMDKETGLRRDRGETFTINDEVRLREGIAKGAFVLTAIHPPKTIKKTGKTIVVHQWFLNKIGGIETANYNLAQKFKNRNLIFVFTMFDLDQALRIGRTAEVLIDDGTTNLPDTDVLILANYDSYPKIKGRIKARKIYQQIHADWKSMRELDEWKNFTWKPDKDVDKVIAVSDTVQESLKTAFPWPIKSVVVPNVPIEPPANEFKVFLTLSRLSAEKGADRIAKMVETFHACGKQFLWMIAATPSSTGALEEKLRHDSSVCFIGPNIERSRLLEKVDYNVILSDNESYCFSAHEARAVGCPIIGTKIPELEKIVKPGKNGFLVEKDLSDLDRALIDKIFKANFERLYFQEKVDPAWDKVLGGKL